MTLQKTHTDAIKSYTRVRAAKNRTILSAAIILCILGTGNILFGKIKRVEYGKAFQEAQTLALSNKADGHPEVIPGSQVSTPQSLNNLRKIKARIEFYDFVVLGGAFFLAIAIALLIAWYVSSADDVPENDDDSTQDAAASP